MSSENIKKDPFIRSLFEEGGLEHPSGNFTNKIVNNIKTPSGAETFEYKPVISRKAWFITGVFIVILLTLAFLQPTQGPQQGLYQFDSGLYIQKVIAIFNKITGSFRLTSILKTALVAFSFFVFMSLTLIELKSRSLYK